MSFENLGLRPEILTGVKFQGYVEPTPIQRQAIPVIIQGRDILAGAQTGTGKTAAFTLPLLHILSTQGHRGGHRPRALVLAPTRELAAQVGESIEAYGWGLHIRSAVIFGGVGINPQIKQLRRGVNIVIGTPGRLLDLAGQKVLNLSCIEVLILDEADRMLDMGFIHDIRKIIHMVPKKRQTLFFSATYSREIKALADTILYRPKLVEVAGQNAAAETVDQSVFHVSKSRKCELLSHLITEGDWNQVLVFTKTKHGANRLARQLGKNGIMAAAIHGNKSQSARTLALAEFKACNVRVLVATDIASRGLDIDRLPHVVNYDMPNVAEDYVHRIGRTGRAGSTGESISLVMDEEVKLLRAIERLIKKAIPVKHIEGFSGSVKAPAKDKTAGVEAHRHRRRGGNKGAFRGGKPHKSKGNSSGGGRRRVPKG
ncbi:ATP-dependent RNA helicase RhlE [Candidatus Scalindua japonica]|uniref:DEAD-box ATP-dependent RNA helicase RhpA n=1 Tax=Candidatus Scalindua japonica TaxID=1284222 RepID=A0A286TZ16_9BACT|nr:DEAD/DEAH box helicase [Candidatus Scalindua japonica]GAX61159.1 ATP-dependent RNA helicase RhlE [Candidatus Scalindua japonica]